MPEKGTITLEEFLEMKRQEARQMALANSYNATEPRLAKKYYSEEDIKDLENELRRSKNLYDEFDAMAKETYKDLNHPLAPDHLFIFNPIYRNPNTESGLNDFGTMQLDALIRQQRVRDSSKKEINEFQNRLEHINKHGYDWSGFGCITNATGWYGDPYVCASNIQFKENPSKYGFVEINANDALPGDIFQYDSDGQPYHATMYSKKGDDNEFYSNYSNGDWKSPIKHDSDYWGQGERAFRFVGLPEDVDAWTKEYNDNYKKLGGMKKIKQKKYLGAIMAVANIAMNIYQAHKQAQAQIEQNRNMIKEANVADNNARIANMNQLANNDMSWAYDKFKPAYRCGGKKTIKASLGKFRPRFEK